MVNAGSVVPSVASRREVPEAQFTPPGSHRASVHVDDSTTMAPSEPVRKAARALRQFGRTVERLGDGAPPRDSTSRCRSTRCPRPARRAGKSKMGARRRQPGDGQHAEQGGRARRGGARAGAWPAGAAAAGAAARPRGCVDGRRQRRLLLRFVRRGGRVGVQQADAQQARAPRRPRASLPRVRRGSVAASSARPSGAAPRPRARASVQSGGAHLSSCLAAAGAVSELDADDGDATCLRCEGAPVGLMTATFAAEKRVFGRAAAETSRGVTIVRTKFLKL